MPMPCVPAIPILFDAGNDCPSLEQTVGPRRPKARHSYWFAWNVHLNVLFRSLQNLCGSHLEVGFILISYYSHPLNYL